MSVAKASAWLSVARHTHLQCQGWDARGTTRSRGSSCSIGSYCGLYTQVVEPPLCMTGRRSVSSVAAFGAVRRFAPSWLRRQSVVVEDQQVDHRSKFGTSTPDEVVFYRRSAEHAFELHTMRVDQWRGDNLVIFFKASTNGPLNLGHSTVLVDQVLHGHLNEFLTKDSFEAAEGTFRVLQIFGHTISRVLLIGLGSEGAFDWRLAGATVASALREAAPSGASSHDSTGLACFDGIMVQQLVEGILLGLHRDLRFRGSKTRENQRATATARRVQMIGDYPAGSGVALERAQAVVSGVVFARELVNAPANIVTPPTLAKAAVNLAEQLGLKVQILDEVACEKRGMGCFLAVGRASDLPSCLIHLTYVPEEGTAVRKVGMIGKGLTFDSGGYNLKVGEGSMIEMMKFDMGGAAAVLGAAAAIARLRPKGVEVHFVIAACENMISGNHGALRPGDIITAMDGTTVEVNNTDAEGRLTLADALLYCQEEGVTEVVDVATLTGACMISLGKDIAGLWSNSDEVSDRLERAAKVAGEKVWRMPLEESYFELLKSDFADMKNTGTRYGGAITAALFLQKFVRKETKWAHLDIAGPVWAEKPKGINGIGGTGTMVRTLTAFVESSDA